MNQKTVLSSGPRKARGLTQNDVARHLEVHEKTIHNWESGASLPNLEQIEKLLKLYECEFGEL